MKERIMMFLYTFLMILVEIIGSESAMNNEDRLFELLNGYIRSQEEEISELKRVAEDFKQKITITKSDASRSTSNPDIAFKITRRLVRDWNATLFLITSSEAQDEFRRKWRDIERTSVLPNEEDLKKDTANLHSNFDRRTLASWEHVGVKNRSELTATECYELGLFSFSKLDFERTTLWLSEALARYDMDDEWFHVDRSSLFDLQKTLKWKILNTLPHSILLEGENGRALNLTKGIKEELKNHEGAWNSQQLIEKVMEKTEAAGAPISEMPKNENTYGQEMIMRYKSLCRSGIQTNLKANSKLQCRYIITSPFTKLARLKEEVVFANPRILVFRDVIHDSEVENIKEIITPLMMRGLAADESGIGQYTSQRIAKQHIIPESHDFVRKIQRRVEDMSRMSTESAEGVNVVNYGLGGHYIIHYDHEPADGNRIPPDWEGNRIASLLFYLSDVKKGGETVFPALNLSVRPEKGSVLMWRNLLYNGDSDDRILHAACPVFQGSKWVITFMLHTVGNELLQQCTLNRHE